MLVVSTMFDGGPDLTSTSSCAKINKKLSKEVTMEEVVDKLEQGRYDARLSCAITMGMREELELWSEVAGWPLAKVVRYLLALAIRTYEADKARDYGASYAKD